jgi:hypothetical protein
MTLVLSVLFCLFVCIYPLSKRLDRGKPGHPRGVETRHISRTRTSLPYLQVREQMALAGLKQWGWKRRVWMAKTAGRNQAGPATHMTEGLRESGGHRWSWSMGRVGLNGPV